MTIVALAVAATAAGVVTHGQTSATGTFSVRPLDNPTPPAATTPNLTSDGTGRVYLSWIEHTPRGDRLQFAQLEDSGWSAPQTIAFGDDWFVNWADVPSLAVDDDGPVAAHFLRRSGDETYAYDAVLSTPAANGQWRPAMPLHLDRSATEHGFVSLVPLAGGAIFATWLDGRNFASAGPMTLRYGLFDRTGDALTRGLLDERTCECCPTAAVETSDGVLVAYRDRTAGEIRDIYVVRVDEDGPHEPVRVHDDGWEILGCPVNGPALAASGNDVALAWFTAAGGSPSVHVAFSDDAGISFGAPYRLDEGRPLGRVAVALRDDGTAVVAWLEARVAATQILYRHVGSGGTLSEPAALAVTSRARASGYPRLARSNRGLVAAWTEPGDPSFVRTAVLHGPR